MLSHVLTWMGLLSIADFGENNYLFVNKIPFHHIDLSNKSKFHMKCII